MKSIVTYEARLSRDIKRTPYGIKRVYKKGKVIWECSEKTFLKLTKKSLSSKTDLAICEGMGVYEYFYLETDIEFFRVETITTKKEKRVKLK